MRRIDAPCAVCGAPARLYGVLNKLPVCRKHGDAQRRLRARPSVLHRVKGLMCRWCDQPARSWSSLADAPLCLNHYMQIYQQHKRREARRQAYTKSQGMQS